MDKELLQEMVEKYGNMVYRLAWRSTGSRDQAEDITQETFLRAFTHLDSYDRNRPPGPWLCRIALNLCRNRPARQEDSGGLCDGRAAMDRTAVPEQSGNRSYTRVQSLPPMYREVILPTRERTFLWKSARCSTRRSAWLKTGFTAAGSCCGRHCICK